MGTNRNTLRLFGEGSKCYLEFLRNLTPQILLLAFTLIVGKKLNFSVIDFSNWLQTMVFFVLLFAFTLAVFCNIKQLVSGCYPELDEWLSALPSKAKKSYALGFRNVYLKLIRLIKNHWLVGLEFIFMVLLLQVIIAVIVVAAINSAVTMLNIMS